MKISFLTGKLPSHLQDHVTLNTNDASTYQEIKAALVNYFKSKKAFLPPSYLQPENASSSSTGPAPMQIGQVQSDKGHKGSRDFKGSGKGKNSYGHGRGRGKGRFGRGRGRFNRHYQPPSYQGSKGKGYSSKGKGKGSYGKSSYHSQGQGKGFKGQGKSSVTCYTCGRQGHTSKFCRQGNQPMVQQVQFDPNQIQNPQQYFQHLPQTNMQMPPGLQTPSYACLLYNSDAADEQKGGQSGGSRHM